MLRRTLVVVGSLFASAFAACDPGQTVTSSGKTASDAPIPIVCKENEVRTAKGCVVPPIIKVDTVGYLVDRVKLATLPATSATDSFAIVDTKTDKSVFDGKLTAAKQNADTADSTQTADFSEFKTPGTYVVRIKGLDDSPPFVIDAGAWNDALRVVMLGLYGQRCGVDIEFTYQGTTFKHKACHLKDALYGGTFASGAWTKEGELRDGTGGWHDAGDYGKYTVNAAFALAFLFKAWEDFGDKLGNVHHVPNYDGELPQWLAEGKFQMDQLLKMQIEDGSALHMIGPLAFPGTILPDVDTDPRRFTGPGSAATADLVAIAAMAARVYRPFDSKYADTCLAAAQKGQAFLDANTTPLSPSYAGFTHNAYNRSQDSGERFWAITELWRTTGDAALLTRVETALPADARANFDWGNVENLGLFSYVQAQSDARDATKLAAAQQAVITSAKSLANVASEHSYGRSLGSMYYWGVNGVLARTALNLLVANQIAPDKVYLDAAAQQVDHLFGRNPFGRTMVTGLGFLPARDPHHRPSQGDGLTEPWPGLLVGGPNSQSETAKSVGAPPGLAWYDSSADYYVNEVAINWNTALAYALAGFYE